MCASLNRRLVPVSFEELEPLETGILKPVTVDAKLLIASRVRPETTEAKDPITVSPGFLTVSISKAGSQYITTIPGIPGGLTHAPITLKSMQFKFTIPRISAVSTAKALPEKRIKNKRRLKTFLELEFIFLSENIRVSFYHIFIM